MCIPLFSLVFRLRFDCDLSGNTSTSCYISCDNFFLEVELSSDGMVGEVKLGHGDVAPQPQPKLQTLLRTGRYMAFCRHLRGLIAIYDLPGPKEDRATVYSALCSIEKDLLAYSNSIRYGILNLILTFLNDFAHCS